MPLIYRSRAGIYAYDENGVVRLDEEIVLDAMEETMLRFGPSERARRALQRARRHRVLRLGLIAAIAVTMVLLAYCLGVLHEVGVL
ncbi:MAG TPA: hypothetical protein VFV77_01665 [Gammaproteobacteria bacterium]|nr:hypothetical protein [Gammaproteobacteria bacterium]